MDDLRITPETCTVGMIRRQEDAPRVVDQQQQLQSHRPLHCVHHVASPVRVRHDTATGLVLNVQVAPLPAGKLIEKVLPRTIGGDRHGVAEQDRPGIRGEIGMSIEILGQSC